MTLTETYVTQPSSWHEDFRALVSDQWVEVDQRDVLHEVTAILGYDPALISAGTSAVGNPRAPEYYETLMMDLLGYVLVEVGEADPLLTLGKEGIADLTEGRTTSHESVEAFDEYLRKLGESS